MCSGPTKDIIIRPIPRLDKPTQLPLRIGAQVFLLTRLVPIVVLCSALLQQLDSFSESEMESLIEEHEVFMREVPLDCFDLKGTELNIKSHHYEKHTHLRLVLAL